MEMLVGIPGTIGGQLLPVQVEISIKPVEPEKGPEEIVVLYPAFPESQLGSVIELRSPPARKQDAKKDESNRDLDNIQSMIKGSVSGHGSARK
jgi:hypothetical protein